MGKRRVLEVTKALLGYQPGDKVRIIKLEPSFGERGRGISGPTHLLGQVVTLKERWVDSKWDIVGEHWYLEEESFEPAALPKRRKKKRVHPI